MSDLTLSPVTQSPLTPRREAELRGAAQELEAAFLSEMLRHGGLGTPRDSFGGGHGEDQFASFLRTEQARAMAAGGESVWPNRCSMRWPRVRDRPDDLAVRRFSGCC